MGLNLKVTVFAGLLTLTSGMVKAQVVYDEAYLTIDSMEVRELFLDVKGQAGAENFSSDSPADELQNKLQRLNDEGKPDPIANTGKVIGLGKDLVALGESVYKLVIKGKPTNTTVYAPISIIPKENGEAIDIMATENWKMPMQRSYEVVYKNFYRMTVVKFRYSVIFSYGGTYNGKGAYLTAVQIVPERVETSFGYDFTATMKLGGIQNQSSRENPVAAAILLMEYTVNTLVKAGTFVDTIFVSGDGKLKKY